MKKFLIISAIFIFTSICVQKGFCAEPYIPATEAKLEYNRGIDFYKIGQYDRAMASFRTAINIDPNYIDAYFNLGSILEYLNQNDAALSVFKQIIVRKPDDYESLYKAAAISVKLDQPAKAKEYLAAIPANSSVYRKAQNLAVGNLNSDLQTIKEDKAKSETVVTEQFTSSNAIYDNITSPTGITTDKSGNLYVASFSDNTIYKITPDGKRIVFLKDPKINGPIGMVSDDNGNIYLANYNSNNVLKISPTGGLTTLIANVLKPYGLHIEDNLLFISCQGSNSILQYKLN